MKEQYLHYYQKFTLYAPFVFLLDTLFTHSNVRRWSLLNRQKDYMRLCRRQTGRQGDRRYRHRGVQNRAGAAYIANATEKDGTN